MPPRIDIDQDKLREFCRKWRIKRLWLFGSVLRDDFRDDSDVDVLYEFEEGVNFGWDIIHVQDELAEIVGRKVDFIPDKYLKSRVRSHPAFKKSLVYDA